ncbi:reactive intermediate/imine deaminase [Actinacidiphila yanglinensis]|uniref:Reactive intermediate/imine deaminase n=1 Tax=Actinacidiphila yanglinensis TaxID=310779 RepID=A0A1H6D3F0_9ACTN|nr:RidA family protein [Actinacidiphila yanglinensis]SEG79594.1 reactive intermediate/imine deaminase [Actinacidiphila yanglinensis]
MITHYERPEGSAPVNGYSHAVAFTGTVVVVSGQVPLDADGTLVGEGDAEVQTRQVFENLTTVLAASGARWADVVRISVFLTDIAADLPAFRRVRDEYVDPARMPASSLVQVAGLVHPAFRVEIEAMAVVGGAEG